MSDAASFVAQPAAVDLHLTIDQLTYHGHSLFCDIDLRFPAGAWTAILGPSGVGKSTVLRLLAGLETGGRLGPRTRVCAADGQALAGRVAYMAQRDGLLPWLSALDNVMLGSRLRRGDRIDRATRDQALALLDLVGLAGRARDRPGALSGGMRQRVALARTLMEDRPVVLMDEPFSALDPPTRLRLGDLAARLLAGRTVVLITHDPMEALRLAHRVLILSGRPVAVAEPLLPVGVPPRAPDDPAVTGPAGALLAALATAAAAEETLPPGATAASS